MIPQIKPCATELGIDFKKASKKSILTPLSFRANPCCNVEFIIAQSSGQEKNWPLPIRLYSTPKSSGIVTPISCAISSLTTTFKSSFAIYSIGIVAGSAPLTIIS